MTSNSGTNAARREKITMAGARPWLHLRRTIQRTSGQVSRQPGTRKAPPETAAPEPAAIDHFPNQQAPPQSPFLMLSITLVAS
jgi:hypothetical protein